MNRSEDTTATPDAARNFPIPYPGTSPSFDLYEARALLSVVQDALIRACCDDEGMSKKEADDLCMVVGRAVDLLETLQDMLDEHDSALNIVATYQCVRRRRLLRRWGERS